MLKSKLLHPEILAALGGAGHGTKVLIADGNYQFGTAANPAATRVYLNLAPGMVTVTDVLRVLVQAIPIEAAEAMIPETGIAPTIHTDFRAILPSTVPLNTLARFDFYAAACHSDTALVIATGEQRIYANLLLTLGVVMP